MQIANLKDIDQSDLDRIMRRSAAAFDDVLPIVERIMHSVQEGGDRAVRRYNQKFGGSGTGELAVTRAEIDAAYRAVDAQLVDALHAAMHNIETFHASELHEEPPVQGGQEFDFKVIKMSEAEKKIGLSIRALGEDEERTRLEEYQRRATAATLTIEPVP